jgi:predicted Zn finger-like uncharacterized protein
MIVQCDNCKAKFNLADDKITDKGLKVRCSKCKTVFVAKKAAADSVPAAPPPHPPAPPPGAAPPPPKPAAAESADPFSDFTFSDDLDLDSKEDTAPGTPVTTERSPATPSHHDYAPTSVPAPTKPEPLPPLPPEAGAEDQFNFTDDAFTQPEPPPRKPAPPKAQPAAKAPAPAAPQAKAKPAGSSDDSEFGDFNFDEESFAEPGTPPPQAAAPAAPAADDWGSVSLPPPAAKPPAGKAPAKPATEDEESSGDFHFDTEGSIGAAASDAGAGDDLGDFVRSATSKAPVQDELEASLESDSESEPTPAPRPAAPASAARPAKPVIRHVVKERNWTFWILLGVLVLFLAAIGGGIGFLQVTGRFTLRDLMSGNFAKAKQIPEVKQFFIRMGWMEAPDTGTVEVLPRTREDAFFLSRDGVDLLVVKGTVRNGRRKPQSFMQVEVTLKDKAGDVLAVKRGYCDVTFSNEELRTLSREDIEGFMNARAGRNLLNHDVRQNQTREFNVVFYPVPAGVNNAEARVAGYMDSEEAADVLRKEAAGKSPEAPKPPEEAQPPEQTQPAGGGTRP